MKIRHILLIVLSLASCTPAKKVVMLMRPFTREISEFDAQTTTGIMHACEANGFLFDTVTLENETISILSRNIDTSGADIVICDPLSVVPPEKLAEENPGTLFIVEQRNPAIKEAVKPNLLVIEFDRLKAAHRIGLIAGVLAADPAFRTNFDLPTGTLPKFGAVYHPSAVTGDAEHEKMREGFAAEAPEASFVRMTLPDVTDQAEAKRTIESMWNDSVRIFYLKAYNLSSVCLETIRRLKARVVLENWNLRFGYDDIVVFGTVERTAPAIGSSLDLYKKTRLEPSHPVWPAGSIEGEIGFAWGSLIKIPDRARAIINNP